MNFHDPMNSYPHKLYRPEACIGWKAQNRSDQKQLKNATKTFINRVSEYQEMVGYKSALTLEQKKEMMPYLKMLAESGWGGSTGGHRSTGGGGRFSIGKPPKNPLLHRITDSDGDGVQDTRPRNPMDSVGIPGSPSRGNVGGLTAAEEMHALKDENSTEEDILAILTPIWAKHFNLEGKELDLRVPNLRKAAKRLIV